MSYYDRVAAVHIDGTPIFATAEDAAAEREAFTAIEAAWGCEIHPFGPLSPIEAYATRHGRLVGLVEVKHRSHRFGEFPTVFLNVRKWMALLLGSQGLGVPAVFVVRFADGLWQVEVGRVDPQRVVMGGTTRMVKARSDVEPVIEVPVEQLTKIEIG